VKTNRRTFLKLAGAAAGSAALGACGGGASSPAQSAAAPSPTPTPPVTNVTGTISPQMANLQAFLRGAASPTFSVPGASAESVSISWAAPLNGNSAPGTSLPGGSVIPVSSPLIGGPLRAQYVANLAGNPLSAGYPCFRASRSYTTSRGLARTADSPTILRFKTDAPVFEISGVIPDGSFTSQTLIVDGKLVPTKMLTSARGVGGWNQGTVRVAFTSRQVRDIWIETGMYAAYITTGTNDSLLSANDAGEPQITFVGDSYLQSRSGRYGNGAAIALDTAARLGIRKVAVDSLGGTGYWNTGNGAGNLNDRLPGHAADNSTIYLIMAGLNDYGDLYNGAVTWPTRATYEQSVLGYLQGLRAAQPNALLVVTAPFCPDASLSDSTYVGSPSTNTSGLGDFLYKAQVHKTSLQKISAPWVYIDVLMGTGWLNSSGATGDISNLQWFTGGTPAVGTTATYKPGNTQGGAGGGFGGILAVPVMSGGQYSQAPDLMVSGGSGSGLLLFSAIDSSGSLTTVFVACPGQGYTAGAGLPLITVDSAYQQIPAALGTPVLMTPTNPNGEYPLPSFAPAGSPGNLNNIVEYLMPDLTHPSPAGVDYLASRLSQNIYQALMAL